MLYSVKSFLLSVIVLLLVLFNSFSGLAYEQRSYYLKKGENLAILLRKAAVKSPNSSDFIEALRYRIDLKKLSIGQEFKLVFDEEKNLISVIVPLKRNKSVLAIKSDSGKINAHILNNNDLEIRIRTFTEFEKIQNASEGTFDFILGKGDNLTKLLVKSGVDAETIYNISTIISEEIDLYKLKPGDKLSLSFISSENDIKLDSLILYHNKKNVSLSRDAFGIFRKSDNFLLGDRSEDKSEIINNNLEELNNKFLINLIRSMGFSYKESERAAAALSTVSDPTKIKKDTALIAPPIGEGKNSFALKISDNEAILVHRDAYGDFVAKKSDINKAEEFVANKNRLLKQSRTFRNQGYENFNIISSEIYSGDTLIKRFLSMGINIRVIRRVISELKKTFNPNKIAVGKKLIIATYEKNSINLAGFFIETKKNQGVLVTKSITGFKSKIINLKVVEKQLNLTFNAIKGDSEVDPYFLHVTDIDLLGKIPYTKKNIKIKKGDTLIKSLTELGISRKNASESLEVLKSIFNPKSLKSGQILSVVSSGSELHGYSIEIDKFSSLQIIKENGKYNYYTYNKPLTKKVINSSGLITKSLYKAAMDINLPMGILMEMVRIYSFDIDFQRDIRPGDGFEVMYEHLLDENGNILGYGNLLLSTMIVGKIRMPFYRLRGP